MAHIHIADIFDNEESGVEVYVDFEDNVFHVIGIPFSRGLFGGGKSFPYRPRSIEEEFILGRFCALHGCDGDGVPSDVYRKVVDIVKQGCQEHAVDNMPKYLEYVCAAAEILRIPKADVIPLFASAIRGGDIDALVHSLVGSMRGKWKAEADACKSLIVSLDGTLRLRVFRSVVAKKGDDKHDNLDG